MQSLKEKVYNKEKVSGVFVGTYSPNLVEIAGYSNFDFVVIDDEHGAFSASELENMIRTAESVDLIPIVRVSYDPSSIQKALDRGAKGIHVPMVSSKEQAKEVVNQAKFPPNGNRGVAYSHRAAQFGAKSGKKFLEETNDGILIAVHIETEEAVSNFVEIMGVPGIDLAFLGTTDLSVNMGYPEGLKSKEMQSVVENIYSIAKDSNINIGTVTSDIESAQIAYEQGANYVVLVGISYIYKAFKDYINGLNDTKQ